MLIFFLQIGSSPPRSWCCWLWLWIWSLRCWQEWDWTLSTSRGSSPSTGLPCISCSLQVTGNIQLWKCQSPGIGALFVRWLRWLVVKKGKAAFMLCGTLTDRPNPPQRGFLCNWMLGTMGEMLLNAVLFRLASKTAKSEKKTWMIMDEISKTSWDVDLSDQAFCEHPAFAARQNKQKNPKENNKKNNIFSCVSVLVMIIALIVFPVMFLQEINSRDKPEWFLGWAYGIGWGATIFMIGAAILLLVDKESEEIFYREKTYYAQDETDAWAVDIAPRVTLPERKISEKWKLMFAQWINWQLQLSEKLEILRIYRGVLGAHFRKWSKWCLSFVHLCKVVNTDMCRCNCFGV